MSRVRGSSHRFHLNKEGGTTVIISVRFKRQVREKGKNYVIIFTKFGKL